ncbi:2b054138-d574-491b-9f12-f07b415e42c0-CDS [Sclerotinia trifoliorum]|uniref:2b054138-d574-491b-9f12-f07b415e42c0-CDS n=1 Tax=Sclerotinia trifoliorum TaxID=28548 RepID=A0A8H2W4T3_9HELO|nr:2b054138-d574-491b-9f12-f07b415e42c0-CDS [Sclerotinia trifoliorum]
MENNHQSSPLTLRDMDNSGVGSSGSGGNQGGDQGSSGSSVGPDQNSYASSGSQAIRDYNAQITTAYQSTPTSASTLESPTNSAIPSSTSSTSGGSSNDRAAIIGGVLGGVGALLIISLIALYLLQNRKTKKAAAQKRVTQQVSYNRLNSSFAGVPFIKRNSQASDNEISPPPMVADTSYQGAHMRGGQSSYPDLSSDMETDRFLPSDEESQQRMAGRVHSSFDHLATPSISGDPFTDQNRLSQISGNTASPPRPGKLVRHDTMGFPLDDDDTSYIGPDGEEHRLSRIMHSPRASVFEPTIMSPSPIRPTISHENLERGFSQSQDLNQSRPIPQHLNSLSSNYDNPEFENEDSDLPPIQSYGGQQTTSPVPMQSGAWIAAHHPHLAAAFSMGDVHRNMSTRTQSSFAPSVISDTELDRLGVGQRP